MLISWISVASDYIQQLKFVTGFASWLEYNSMPSQVSFSNINACRFFKASIQIQADSVHDDNGEWNFYIYDNDSHHHFPPALSFLQ